VRSHEWIDRRSLALHEAVAAVSNERDIIVIGSQAVLGQCPDAPEALLTSIVADVLRERLSTIALPPDRMQALQDRLRRVERTSGLDPHQ